jgi:DNA-binding MarR family transcriptional regulator
MLAATPAGAAPTTVSALRLAIMRLARRTRQHTDERLTPSRLSALTTVARWGPMPLGELARREHVSRSTITRMAARLEHDGFVDRRRSSHDGRSAIVELTEDGRLALAAMDERVDAYLARQFAALTDAERRTLQDALPVLERLLEVRA